MTDPARPAGRPVPPSPRFAPAANRRNPLASRMLIGCRRHRIPLVCKLLQLLLNCDIYGPVRADTRMPHPYGIIIHGSSRIGAKVLIMQQVTIGAKDAGNAAPTIEDDVVLGAGAKILGGITVGRGAVVGANAVVTKDVPPGAVVVGANRVVRIAPPGANPGPDKQE